MTAFSGMQDWTARYGPGGCVPPRFPPYRGAAPAPWDWLPYMDPESYPGSNGRSIAPGSAPLPMYDGPDTIVLDEMSEVARGFALAADHLAAGDAAGKIEAARWAGRLCGFLKGFGIDAGLTIETSSRGAVREISETVCREIAKEIERAFNRATRGVGWGCSIGSRDGRVHGGCSIEISRCILDIRDVIRDKGIIG